MELVKPGKGNEITAQVILWGVIFFNFCDSGSAHHGRREFEARGILAQEIKPRSGFSEEELRCAISNC